MKNKKIVIIIIVIVILGTVSGIGLHFLINREKANPENSNEEDRIPDSLEFVLTKEDAYKLLEERYKDEKYLIKFEKEIDDSFVYEIKNKESNLVELLASVNKYTKNVTESKIVLIGEKNSSKEIFGGKIE